MSDDKSPDAPVRDPSSGITRMGLLRAPLVLGAVGSASLLGGCSIWESIIKSTSKGAVEGVDEATQGKLNKGIEDAAKAAENFKKSSEDAKAISGQLEEIIRENKGDIRKIVHDTANVTGGISDLVDALRRGVKNLEDIIDKYGRDPKKLVEILEYYFSNLAKKVAAEVLRLIALLLYILMIEKISKLIEELKRSVWWVNLLADIL